MKEIVMVTGNIGKWKIASDIFEKSNVNLLQEKIDTPEIQSSEVEEVSLFSAKFASEILGKAVIKSDVGYYIEELGGFPGPFVKFINEMLKPEDLLKMMEGKKRKVILKECLTYYEPSGKYKQFISINEAEITDYKEGSGSTFDQILILKGFNKPKGTYDDSINIDYFKNNLKIYEQAAEYINSKI